MLNLTAKLELEEVISNKNNKNNKNNSLGCYDLVTITKILYGYSRT